MPNSHIQNHIELIARHEQEFLERRTKAERIGDFIATSVGSFTFVVGHLVLFLVWILFNTSRTTEAHHFDPRPFSLLGTLVGMEAILLVSFLLMRQLRIGRRADERDHLMLQVLLLSERELTLLLRVERQIATRIGLTELAGSQELNELTKTMSIEGIAKKLRDAIPTE